ncbi:ribbon-helix-helix domain-containing protein [Halomonas ramblicola]|uniref:ribbon-helix-helix domain-containing protein n=1 Tax=Halomonas ramblicola TaxID=747349 RepID=UPI0025B524DA|nr:ribbon-helix-helix domain-containing protein [Halomonas ramblicola]MDN3520862.1 ribbon-helix-helix domain-containing protein [Halomonas ramblicola]
MCKLFTGADPELWAPQTRSMRLDGACTSVRLEGFYWAVLEEIGRRDGLTLAQLVGRLSRECHEAGHDRDNFASFLRVCCGRYLTLQLAGEIPVNRDAPIADLDAEAILARERHHGPRRADQAVADSCSATA